MQTVSISEAKIHFDELMARVALGEDIVITRHNLPIARVISNAPKSLSGVREAVAELRRLQKEIASQPGYVPLTDEEIRSAIEEGRM